MRYLLVSDIHGYYNKLVAALNKSNFDKNKDTLVCVGDPFDRGPQSKEVLEFLMSCPNKILIWGNHDARLHELYTNRDSIAAYDISNGISETLKSFTMLQNVGLDIQLYLLKYDECYKKTRALLNEYFKQCVWAAEFKDVIITHAWLPHFGIRDGKGAYVGAYLREDWREATKDEWYDATWSNSESLMTCGVYPEDKHLIIGHRHTWRLRLSNGEKSLNETQMDCGIFYSADGHLVGLDGCTSYIYGQVNVLELNTREVPVLYNGKD